MLGRVLALATVEHQRGTKSETRNDLLELSVDIARATRSYTFVRSFLLLSGFPALLNSLVCLFIYK